MVTLEDVVEKGSLARPAEAEDDSGEVSDGSKERGPRRFEGKRASSSDPTVVAESSAREIRWGRLNTPEKSSENSHRNALILQPFPSGRSARHAQATSAPRGANDSRIRTGRAVTLRWPRSGAKAETARIWEADIVESSATKRLPPSKDAAASLSAERV